MSKYRIYPSLLDTFQNYLDAEVVWEKYWGGSEEPSKTCDEYVAECEQRLLDTINRVPSEPNAAADRGTAFNEIVDCIVENRKCRTDGMEIHTEQEVKTEAIGIIGECGRVEGGDVNFIDTGRTLIVATYNGFTFKFYADECKAAAKRYEGSMTQYLCVASLETRYGEVELYGYADEIVKDCVYDIKTTTSYEIGKFAKKYQKDLYPYCLVKSGEMDNVSQFEYTIFVMSKLKDDDSPTRITNVYREQYPYDHKRSEERLCNVCEHLIEWMDANKEKITNTRIYGQQYK